MRARHARQAQGTPGRRLWWIAVAVVAGSAGLTLEGRATPPPPPPSPPGASRPPAAATLVYCTNEAPDAFNPALSTTPATRDAIARPLFEGLTRFRPGTTVLEPALAERWSVSEDGKTYTFFLRPQVAFHKTATFTPSRPLTAEDVLWSINRQARDDHPYHRVSGATYDSFTALGLTELIEKGEAVDAHTVQFTLTRPWAPFPAALAMEFAAIHSAEYAAAQLKAGTPEAVDRAPVGTGPFVLRERKDDRLRFEAHAGYWGGKPGLTALEIRVVPDAGQRSQKLRAGECQAINAPAAADLDALRADKQITLQTTPGLALAYIGFNTTTPPFNTPAVRRLLAAAVDRAALVETAFQGLAVPLDRPLPPLQWPLAEDAPPSPSPPSPPPPSSSPPAPSSAPSPPALSPAPASSPAGPSAPAAREEPAPDAAASETGVLDPATLKAQLTELGLADKPISLWVLPVRRPYLPDPHTVAQALQRAWQGVGLTVTLETPDWGDYLKRVRAGEAPVFLLGWSTDTGDPDDFLGTLLTCDGVGGFNTTRWCSKPYDDLVRRARVTTDPEERLWAYRDALRMVQDQMPWIPLAAPLVIHPVRKEVVGWTVSPFGGPVFTGLSLTP